MINKKTIFLNSNEHTFDLSFSDNLLLCNYARLNNYYLCSMIGGAESIRDLQESKNIFADAFEFPMIESLFAIEKIFVGLEKVFIKDNYPINGKKIFINISSKNGLKLLEELSRLNVPKFIKREDIVFNFDRRLITKSLDIVNTDNFEITNFEEKINSYIYRKLIFINDNAFNFSISGGITENSINLIKRMNIKPNFIKTGLFTIEIDDLNNQLFEKVFNLQRQELKILNLMNKCLIHKHEYLNRRESHLRNYVDNK